MLNRFQKWALGTTLATYFLIMVGAFVRAAGAGLGCPDWPKCFDRWIPPTDISQVPHHLARYFNIKLAWIEYVNRLIGVSIGGLIFVTFLLALLDYRKNPRVLWSTFAALLGVAYQGWLGSQVVASELNPMTVTLHMVVALVIVSLLLYATVVAFFPHGKPSPHLSKSRVYLGRFSFLALLVLLVQIGVGAFLRGELELIAKANKKMLREEYIHHAGWIDMLHRNLSILVFLFVLGLFIWIWRRFQPYRWLKRASLLSLSLVILQIISGLTLAYAGLPPVFQVIHLIVGTLLLGSVTCTGLLAYRLPHVEAQKPFPVNSNLVASSKATL